MFTPSDETFICREKYKMYAYCSEQNLHHFPDKEIGAADLRVNMTFFT